MKKFIPLLVLVFLLSCGEDDPCEGVVCNNGGTCDNGTCVCPEGYTGPSCSTQKTPTKIIISKIVIEEWPAIAPGGGGWDGDSGPDLFVVFTNKDTGNEIAEMPAYFDNAVAGTSYTYTFPTPVELTAASARTSISLYDYDPLDADDFMGGVEFTPTNQIDKFPSQILIDPVGGTTSFRLFVTYKF